MKTNDIVIVGGGSSGWMTASTLIKEFPDKNITVIESPDFPIVGVGESTLGGIKRWTKFIGLKEEDFFLETDASYKMSIKFTDFYKENSGSFYYPFGRPYVEGDNNPFFYWHLKKYFYPETEISDFVKCLFPATSLFTKNKINENKFNEFDNYSFERDVAYHFDATKFGQYLKKYHCLPNNVKLISSSVKNASVNDEGIEFLILENNEKIYADLFIDCTGFKSLLLGNYLNEKFNSYEEMLPNNRAWATRIPYKNKEIELEPYTNCTAIDNGWCWNIPLWSRLGSGYVYSDKFVSPEDAKKEFKKYLMSNKMTIPRTKEEVESLEFKDVKFRVGIHNKTFVKNVVAIGLSAGFIEPLESNGLFTVHEFLFKLVDILKRGEISQFDRDMYNVSVKEEFDGFSKFVALHYALSHRRESRYWNNILNKNFTDETEDPYIKYQGKTSNFYDMSWRYMINWAHPYNNGVDGIPYISTGMNIFMINDHRRLGLEMFDDKDIRNDLKSQLVFWNNKIEKWEREASKSKTLYSFIEDKFYKN